MIELQTRYRQLSKFNDIRKTHQKKSIWEVEKRTQWINVARWQEKKKPRIPPLKPPYHIFRSDTWTYIPMQIQIQIQIPICLQRHKIHTNKCHGGRKIRNRVSLHFYKCNYKVYNTAVVFCLHRFCSTFTLRTIFENMGHLKPSDTLSAQWKPNLNPCEPTGTLIRGLAGGEWYQPL